MIEVSIMLIFIKINQSRFVIAHALILKRALINYLFDVKTLRRKFCDDHEIIYRRFLLVFSLFKRILYETIDNFLLQKANEL